MRKLSENLFKFSIIIILLQVKICRNAFSVIQVLNSILGLHRRIKVGARGNHIEIPKHLTHCLYYIYINQSERIPK